MSTCYLLEGDFLWDILNKSVHVLDGSFFSRGNMDVQNKRLPSIPLR